VSCPLILEVVLSGRSRGVIGRASRGVVAEIDERLKTLDEQLSSHEELLAERDRLRAARATLLGESPSGQISQDQVAEYLAEHPGSRAGQIAEALGVSSGRVSAHLYRAKTTRFLSRSGAWYLREKPAKGAR
jgi:DNA-directed RNA polymerase specialized sigma24 family protein